MNHTFNSLTGCGIVEFNSPQDAQKAINVLSETELKGRLIFVREDREERGGGGDDRLQSRQVQMPQMNMHRQMNMQNQGQRPQYQQSQGPGQLMPLGCRLYVGNLSWDVKWQELKDFFKPYGTVVRADVMEEPSGRSKGCGKRH